MNLTLDCATARERLSARLDGEQETDMGIERALLLHLADCPPCRAHGHALAELAPAWQALREVTPPVDLWERIELRVASARVARRAPALARVAAALVGFLSLGGTALVLENRENRTPGAPLAPRHALERWLASLSSDAADPHAFLAALPEYRLLRTLPHLPEETR